jgi:hypothetical protein
MDAKLTAFHVKRRTKTDGVQEEMMRIFGPGRDVVTGGWRKLNNEELHNLWSSLYRLITKIIRMRWAGIVAFNGQRGSAYNGLVV